MKLELQIIALDVCDIEAAFKDCKENKLTILNKNIEFLPFWSNGIKHFEIQGVNNEKIEFCQKLQSYKSIYIYSIYSE